MNHWICIQLKGDRIYAGNPGYEDELGQHYEYDSFVGNHLQVAAGDILVLRDRSSVLGLGQVESIRSSNGTKRHFRCPTCGIPQIQARKKRQFRYRCADGHEFDHALEEAAPCTIFRAIFKQPFLSPTHPLEAKTVRIGPAIVRLGLGEGGAIGVGGNGLCDDASDLRRMRAVTGSSASVRRRTARSGVASLVCSAFEDLMRWASSAVEGGGLAPASDDFWLVA